MNNSLINQLLPRRAPDLTIGPASDPYMNRWHLHQEGDTKLYLHQVLRSDTDRVLHDHPADSWSLLLNGRLAEQHASPKNMRQGHEPRMREITSNCWTFRPAADAHRLVLISDAAWTLFSVGPTIRRWGFWYGTKWMPWNILVDIEEYSLMKPDWETLAQEYIEPTSARSTPA